MSMMSDKKLYIRYCIRYEFHNKKKNIAKASICFVLGEDDMSHNTCKHWFWK